MTMKIVPKFYLHLPKCIDFYFSQLNVWGSTYNEFGGGGGMRGAVVEKWGLGWGLQKSHGALDIRDKHSTAPNQTLLLSKQKNKTTNKRTASTNQVYRKDYCLLLRKRLGYHCSLVEICISEPSKRPFQPDFKICVRTQKIRMRSSHPRTLL